MKASTDFELSVDIREVIRCIGGMVGGRVLFRWNSRRGDMPVATAFMLNAKNLLSAKHVGGNLPNEVFDLTYTRCHLGGQRAWFYCSRIGCGRRVAVLFDTTKGFRCRHCAHFVYQSTRERSYDRMLRRSRRLRARVGGGVNLTENFPSRPKGMHWATYERLFRSEAALWGEISSAAPDQVRGRGS